MNKKAESCFHCGGSVASGFALEWDGGTRNCCSASCCHTAQNIIKKGLGDFYRLPRSSRKKDVSARLDGKQLSREQSDYFSRSLAEHSRESFLYIPALHCSSCAWVIERALTQLNGVTQAGINSLTRRVHVVFDDSLCTLNQILHTLQEIGYPAELLEFAELEKQRSSERKTLLKQILVAGFGSMQAMSFALVIYVSGEGQLDQATLSFFKWLGFLVTTPVVFYSAQPFFSGFKKAFYNRNFNMDVPIALGVLLTYAASFYQALSLGGEIYFDSVSMLVFLILLGRYLELLSRHKAQDGLDALNRAMSAFVDKRNAQGELENVRVSSLLPRDRIVIPAGALVPVDGVLVSDYAAVDQSLVSGEFELAEKRKGQDIVSGSMVRGQAIEVEVTRAQENSFVSALQALSLKAQSCKSSLIQDGDKAASRFVFAVLCFSVLTSLLWLMVDASKAFDAALAVLVVSCPCAFALATPAVVTRSLSVLINRGVLMVNSDALKRLLEIDYVVFDKTGTLTDARVRLQEIHQPMQAAQVFGIAASLSQHSQHPLSEAFRLHQQEHQQPELYEVDEIQLLSGLGISGWIEGMEYRLGRAEYVLDSVQGTHDAVVADALVLANAHGLLATFLVEEQLRPQAKMLVSELSRRGIPCEIVSGDAEARVQAIANQLGVEHWQARQLPWQKLQRLEQLKAEGRKVLMVGDGNNDAPILAAAEVSVSFAAGAHLAKSQADILLCSNNLMKVIEVYTLAQQAEHVLQQNKRWAVIYNVVAVPFAALGLVTPWLAAIGMSVSSLYVVGNALRIGKHSVRRERLAGKIQWA